jgi:bifunctional non-homologous end joining protein LigD
LQTKLRRTERIVYCQHVGESGEKLFQAAEQLGLEGVIGKKSDGAHQRGRTPNWAKVKTSAGRQVGEERSKRNE